MLERVLTRPPSEAQVALVAAGRRPATGSGSRTGYFAPEQIVRLGPLGPASLVSVLDVAGLSALPPSTLAAVTEDSGGNPLWAMALATARVTGDPRERPGRGEAVLERHRLDALPSDLRRLLATVALMGATPYDELVQLDPGIETASAEGLRRRLLRIDAGVLTLADPMLARAAVQDLTPVEQRALHRSISELPLPLPQRVEHRDRSVPPGGGRGAGDGAGAGVPPGAAHGQPCDRPATGPARAGAHRPGHRGVRRARRGGRRDRAGHRRRRPGRRAPHRARPGDPAAAPVRPRRVRAGRRPGPLRRHRGRGPALPGAAAHPRARQRRLGGRRGPPARRVARRPAPPGGRAAAGGPVRGRDPADPGEGRRGSRPSAAGPGARRRPCAAGPRP